MIRVLARWQRARWLRAHPGRAGLSALACLPVLYLLPLHRLGLVDEWSAGAWAIAFILPLPLTAIVMRDSARVNDGAVWLYQKGIPLEDVCVLRWTLDLGLVVLLCAWSALGIVFGSALYDADQPERLMVGALRGILAAVPAAWLLFGVAAAGSKRGGDLLVLVAFIALLEPALALFLEPLPRRVLHVFVMPMMEAAALANGPSAVPGGALHCALHLTLWTTLWLILGCWRLRRWRPSASPLS